MTTERKTSRVFSFFYALHRFTFLSIRIAFSLTRASGRLFYQIRNVAVFVDFVLSCLLYLSIPSTFWLVLSSQRERLAVMLALLALNVFFLWLLRQERKECRRCELTPFSIYDINIGSARTLKGSVVLVHCFVNGRKRKWTEEGISQVMAKVERAVSWVEGQAERFGTDVAISSIILPGAGIEYRRAIPVRANDFRRLDEFHELISSAVRHAESPKSGDMAARGKNTCLFVHVLERIRSFAVPDYLGKKQEKGDVEYAVIGYGERPSTYAHELLHLFGADDYYSEYSRVRQAMKLQFLAKSIMFSGGHLPLEHLTVGELTAQNIGWL